jgi:hypothetical protein
LPDPSPAPHLYLAQLAASPEESLSHFGNALTILQAKLAALERVKLGVDGSAGSADEAEDEGEIRRSASRALVGMTELYLTDLWCVISAIPSVAQGGRVISSRPATDISSVP